MALFVGRSGTDDLFFNIAGDDSFAGEGRTDSVAFNGKREDYSIGISGIAVLVRDENPGDGDDGTDHLYSIENLYFSDGMLQVSVTNGEFEVSNLGGKSPKSSSPDVAVATDGNFLLAWESAYNGLVGYWEDSIGAQSFYANGVPQSLELTASNYDYSFSPSVAALNDGTFTVVWQSPGGTGDIYAQRLSADGNDLGSWFEVNTTTLYDQGNPDIASFSNGGFVVTWESDGQDGNAYGVYARLYANDGTPVGSELRVNQTIFYDQFDPSATVLTDGSFVITWADGELGDGISWGDSIYGRHFAATGVSLGGEFQVASGDVDQPTATQLNDGGFMVAWQSNQDGDGWGVYGRTYEADGTPRGGAFQINTYSTNDQMNTSVAGLADGGFVVVWQSYDQAGEESGGGSNYANDIYARLYASNGIPMGEEFRVNTLIGDPYDDYGQFQPSVASLPDGGFVVTWTSESGNYSTIKGQLFDVNGSALGGISLVGSEEASIVNGGEGQQMIVGEGGSDTLSGGAGNDTLDGGAGTDSAVVRGLVSQYTLSSQGASHVLSGPDGTDTLTSIEYLRFGEDIGQDWAITNVALADVGNGAADRLTEQITDLYVAYFNRAPDSEGLAYWFKTIYTGEYSLRTIAERFTFEQEYLQAYPSSLANRNFIEQIYLNLFDRNPDAGGWNYWSDELDTGHRQRSGFILDVIEGAYAPTSGPEDRTLIDNKHEASLYYSGLLSLQPEEGFDSTIATVLNRVTGEANTLAAAERVIDYAFDNTATLAEIVGNAVLFDSLWAG
jgi:hypothetical protein